MRIPEMIYDIIDAILHITLQLHTSLGNPRIIILVGLRELVQKVLQRGKGGVPNGETGSEESDEI